MQIPTFSIILLPPRIAAAKRISWPRLDLPPAHKARKNSVVTMQLLVETFVEMLARGLELMLARGLELTGALSAQRVWRVRAQFTRRGSDAGCRPFTNNLGIEVITVGFAKR
jgi:hypothetical protein